MSIKCLVCGKEMAKQITNTHLKSHGITTTEYKTLYGVESLTSQEYRNYLSSNRSGENNSNYGKKWSAGQKAAMSEKTMGRKPWNKDKKVGQTENHRIGIKSREEKYKTGVLERQSREMTDDLRALLAEKQSEFAVKNPEEMCRRAKKAVETKKSLGYDFGKQMRGKNHSHETKQRISTRSKESNTLRKQIADKKRLARIHESNLLLLEQYDSTLNLACTKCNNVFTLTKQCFTDSKYKTSWCDVCYPRGVQYRSKSELELYDFIKSHDNSCIASTRQVLKNKELDIYLPDKKIAIEFNGLYWHSEDVLLATNKSKISDYMKMLEAREKGIKYIGILEDEWLFHKDIVKSRIKNIIGAIGNKIPARKCTIREVSSKIAATFCRVNHIQGAGRSNIRYGLYYNDLLVSLMTFTKSNISRKNIDTWEINRFCNALDCTVVGGASKLFNHFIKTVNPEIVISYSDNRWSEGDLYKKLNFTHSGITPPNYWYFLPNSLERIHRYTLRKTKDDPSDLTEKEIRSSQGYLRIWDCGSIKWTWKKGA